MLAADPATATTEVVDIDDGPAIIEVGDVDDGPPGVLPADLAAATTKVGDVDGGPLAGVLLAGPTVATSHHRSWRRRWRAPRGCCRQVWQWPPLKLETSMAGPPGGFSR
jgi:hypothetical protein